MEQVKVSRKSDAPKRSHKTKPYLSTQADIASAAYRRFLSRGAAHGFDVEDWLAAERELQEGQKA